MREIERSRKRNGKWPIKHCEKGQKRKERAIK